MPPQTPNNRSQELLPRPPVVVILGHVDSGKTTLLDFIRKSNVVSQEAGGITQHIGAYQVKHQDKIINFLDTPGHEAFSAMRRRGAKVADVAVLVVAADQGVKPQTKEALKAIKQAKIPMIVAINKIDLPNVILQKTKQALADCQVMIEEFAGKIPCLEISAKTGQAVGELLEMISLVGEMEELKYQPSQSAQGVVIEAHLDPRRGPTATLLINNGTLKKEDVILAENTYGKIKTFQDSNLKPIQESGPGSTIVTGFEKVPIVGVNFKVVKSLSLGRDRAQKNENQRLKKQTPLSFIEVKPEQKVLNLILKVDVAGSQEALEGCLQAIPQDEVILRVLQARVGNITESDVKLAGAGRAQIFGFRVKMEPGVKNLAQQQKVKIKILQVIYELVEAVRQALEQLLSPEIKEEVLGRARVIALFKQEKNAMILGAKILQGKIIQGAKIKVWRDKKIIGQGRIKELQFEKKRVTELEKGKNAGIYLGGWADIQKGDQLEIYQEIRQKKTLE